jgi:hypothetical protein
MDCKCEDKLTDYHLSNCVEEKASDGSSSIWFSKLVSFSVLDEELNAFTRQGYGIAKIHLMPAGDFLIVARKGYVGGVF